MKLTRIEIEEIRALVNACKEKLCNQGRWNEAQEYQDIVDKLDELSTTESVIRCKDCVYHGSVTIGNRVSLTNFCSRLNDCTGEEEFCSRAERKEEWHTQEL